MNASERLAQAAARSEARSLSMLEKLRAMVDLDALLDIDRPRLAEAVEGDDQEDTEPEDRP